MIRMGADGSKPSGLNRQLTLEKTELEKNTNKKNTNKNSNRLQFVSHYPAVISNKRGKQHSNNKPPLPQMLYYPKGQNQQTITIEKKEEKEEKERRIRPLLYPMSHHQVVSPLVQREVEGLHEKKTIMIHPSSNIAVFPLMKKPEIFIEQCMFEFKRDNPKDFKNIVGFNPIPNRIALNFIIFLFQDNNPDNPNYTVCIYRNILGASGISNLYIFPKSKIESLESTHYGRKTLREYIQTGNRISLPQTDSDKMKRGKNVLQTDSDIVIEEDIEFSFIIFLHFIRKEISSIYANNHVKLIYKLYKICENKCNGLQITNFIRIGGRRKRTKRTKHIKRRHTKKR